MTQLGQFRIGLLRNKVTGYVDLETSYEPGRYWIGFWKEFVSFPSTLQTIEFADEKPEVGVRHEKVLSCRDKDGKQIHLDISVQYLLTKDKLGPIYKDMLNQYENIFIADLRDQLAKAANLFAIQDAWLNYKNLHDLMFIRCQAVLRAKHSMCWGLQIWGVTLGKRYEAKLVETQVRKQAQKTQQAMKLQSGVRAETRVLLAEYQKNITILRAHGDAQKYQIVQLAYATAQAKIIAAQAKSLQIVQDMVCPPSARVYNAATKKSACTGTIMNAQEMVKYETQVLLRNLKASNLVYGAKGEKAMQAVNAAAARNIIRGRSRRLLLHESGYDHDKDARQLFKKNEDQSSRDINPARDHRRLLMQESGFQPEQDGPTGLSELLAKSNSNLLDLEQDSTPGLADLLPRYSPTSQGTVGLHEL